MTKDEARERIRRLVSTIAEERKNKKDGRINVSSLTDKNAAGRLSDDERKEILTLFSCKKLIDVLEQLGYSMEGEQETYIVPDIAENNTPASLSACQTVNNEELSGQIKKIQSVLDKKYAALKAECDGIRRQLQEEQDKNKTLNEKLLSYEQQESVNTILLQFKDELSQFLVRSSPPQDGIGELEQLRSQNAELRKMLQDLAQVLPQKDLYGRSEL